MNSCSEQNSKNAIRAETEQSLLLHHFFEQCLIAVNHIIHHILTADRLEMLSCAMNFRFLNEPELHRGHGAFRLGNKVDMLDGTFIESNRPVRIIMPDRRCDIEAVRQLHINRNICVGVQIRCKIALVCGIVHDMMAKSVTSIPATLSRFTAAPINSTKKRRVAAYARVSTDNEEQLTSYEAQVDYYTNYIQGRDDWEFAGVYTDEGITGTNTKKR